MDVTKLINLSKYPINNYSSYLIPTEKEFNENRTLLHAEIMYENNKMNSSKNNK